MEICVDFDGTCVMHEFPKIGKDVPMAVETLRMLIEKGHRIILFTMRSNIENPITSEESEIIGGGSNSLDDAVNWFKDKNIPLYGINKNPDQEKWTKSPKAYGQLYIDDASYGCPLIYGDHNRPYVDWQKIYDDFASLPNKH